MKILVLSNLYPPHYVGGYELHCQTITEALRERGHTVQVLTSDHGVDKNEIVAADVRRLGRARQSLRAGRDGNERRARSDAPYLSLAKPFVGRRTSETTVDSKIRLVTSSATNLVVERSLKIHGMFGHPWLKIQHLKAQEQHNNRMLRNAIRRFKPDLIYGWNMSGLSKSMVFTLQNLGIPTTFVVCDHWIARSTESDVWLRWWNEKKVSLKHRLLRSVLTATGLRQRWHKTAPTNPVQDFNFQRIYFCSNALRDFTADAGFKVRHAATIYCPINIHRFAGTPRTVEQPLKRLLYVGRLTEDKGVMTALRAMALLRNKFTGQLAIYGHGEKEYEKELRTFAQSQKLPVIFESPRRPEEMPSVYHAHDALLFTSEWAEPFALTPLEAMASGLPVIGTTTGGSGELLRHEENSLTYTAGNPEELAQRILQLDKDDSLRAKLASAGYGEVRRRFEESHIVDQIEIYLQETLATWKPQPLDSHS